MPAEILSNRGNWRMSAGGWNGSLDTLETAGWYGGLLWTVGQYLGGAGDCCGRLGGISGEKSSLSSRLVNLGRGCPLVRLAADE